MIETRAVRTGPDAGADAGADAGVEGGVEGVLARLAAVVVEVNELDLAALVRLDGPSAQLLAVGAAVESARGRLQVFDTAYVSALEAGDEPARHGCPSTAAFLREQLRLSPGAAKARVTAARACAARPEFAAGVLPPRCATLAAAQGVGLVSAEHTAVIIAALDQVPDRVAADDVAAMEARLVAEAARFAPREVARLGRRVLDHLDPDGTLRDHDWQQRTRSATLVANHDGTGTLRAQLTVEALEILQTVLGPLAKPVPTGPDGPDPRTPGQRLHDALVDVGRRLLNGGDLPASGGTPTTVVIHINQTQLATRTGLAITDHGNLIPAAAALDLAQDGVLYTLVSTAKHVPLWLGRTTRTATPAQTIALAARDGGCTFPGCDRPPAQCQRHHIREWVAEHGPTDIDNLLLFCGYHHRDHKKRGWTIVMTDGLPWFIPPAWIDPERKPIRNTMHQPRPG